MKYKDPLMMKLLSQSDLDASDNITSNEKLYEIHIGMTLLFLLLANVTARKLIPICGGYDFALSGIFFGLSYLPLLLISDVYGHKKCARVVVIALVTQLTFLLILWISSNLGTTTPIKGEYTSSTYFSLYFGDYGKVIIGSMLAVALSYYFFAIITSWSKIKFCSYSLPIRFFISVGVSKLILVFVAYPINLYGEYSSLIGILKICIITWLIKMMIALVIVIISAYISPIIRKIERKSTYDIGVKYGLRYIYSLKNGGVNLYDTENKIKNKKA